MSKRWEVAQKYPSEFVLATGLEDQFILAQLLWNRGIRTQEEIEIFLHPSWEKHLHDAKQFCHMPGAIERVFKALNEHEPITVHGDYDADGVTGSTLIITVLREIQKKIGGESIVDFYIPHREKEGYGLHRETVSILRDRGTRLIITVDCGIACVDEIALAKQQGMDTIVVDHHQFGEILPDGFLIHPGLPEETYPHKTLAAVGVSFKLACALIEEARVRGLDFPVGYEKWLLDLVAIATVTDMVPLIGENRLLQSYGLQVLNKTRRIGLRALIEAAGLSFGSLDTESVGFAIGPRLNAAGRMDHASLALRLLLSESEEEARVLAQELERCNCERQDATKKMMREAEIILKTQYPILNTSAIALWDTRWSPSLVGLVAGKFADRYARPTIVIGFYEGKWIGSGRSIPGFDITAAMRSVGDGLLTRVGGHPQACGFALDDEKKLASLADRLQAHVSSKLKQEDCVPVMMIDAEISLDQIDESFAQTINHLEPFGEGNRRPMFVSRNCLVVAVDLIGSQKNHLRLGLLAPNGRRIKALGFKIGDRVSEVAIGKTIDLVYHVAINEWQGTRTIECRLIDFVCTSSFAPTEAHVAIQAQPALAS
ncbi:single-stranded-DNA-specific exonuclease RecJ [Candidatus Uhrbacteria bacterium]|nr:single-stranded-DNA-specific exonuclease RecJ [Candidatus Uhrbacteria bacterium]